MDIINIIEVQKLVDFMNAHPYLVAIGVIWTIIWKGLALWRAVEYHARGLVHCDSHRQHLGLVGNNLFILRHETESAGEFIYTSR